MTHLCEHQGYNIYGDFVVCHLPKLHAGNHSDGDEVWTNTSLFATWEDYVNNVDRPQGIFTDG